MKLEVGTIMAIIGMFVLIVMAAFGLSLLLSLPVMWIWNYLMPDLFGLKTIGWWQSWCLCVICNFLFKSVTYNCSNKK